MRHLTGAGTPKEAAARGCLQLIVVSTKDILALVFLAVTETNGEGQFGFLILAVSADRS